MDNEDSNAIALFRFSLIAPLVNDTYDSSSKSQYFRNIASKTHKLPNGKKVKLSSSTIKKWYLLYTNNGFDSLIPKTRSDAGIPRVMNEEVIKKIHDFKENYPYITGKMVRQKLVEEGYNVFLREPLNKCWKPKWMNI